jgi:hypothetical protein
MPVRRPEYDSSESYWASAGPRIQSCSWPAHLNTQLREIFWEGLEHFVEHRGNLITGDLSSALIDIRALEYANAVFEKVGALPNCVGLIVGTVTGIARPGDLDEQRVLYNGHKRKH